MVKKFTIHDWQAKQRRLNEDYYDKANNLNRKDIEHKLDTLLDKVKPSPKNMEARQGIKAALNSNNVVMMKKALDYWSNKLEIDEHHSGEYEPDFLKQSVNTFLDKLKKKTNEGPDYETVEKIMEKHFSAKKEVDEMSTTGGGASFNAGSGEGYMTPNAFKKKRLKK